MTETAEIKHKAWFDKHKQGKMHHAIFAGLIKLKFTHGTI
jgi:hypothetical protein